jgi:hypothetical protein
MVTSLCGMVSNKKDGTRDTWDISYKFGWRGTWDVRIERNTPVYGRFHTASIWYWSIICRTVKAGPSSLDGTVRVPVQYCRTTVLIRLRWASLVVHMHGIKQVLRKYKGLSHDSTSLSKIQITQSNHFYLNLNLNNLKLHIRSLAVCQSQISRRHGPYNLQPGGSRGRTPYPQH